MFSLSSCYRVKPDAGQESVLVMQPFVFGHGGVDEQSISTGATWVVFTTDHKEFMITPVTITEDFINMIPSDNTPVSFSAYLKVQIQKGRTPQLYNNFSDSVISNDIPLRGSADYLRNPLLAEPFY